MSTPYYTEAHQRSLGRLVPDLIRNRELLWDLVVKGLKIRYRIAAMGFFWAVLQPLLMMGILTLVFGYVLGERLGLRGAEEGRSYHVVVLCGVVLWQFFASSVLTATGSLVASRDLIKKVYFPREVIPISTVLDWAFNLAIGTVLLLIIHLLSGGSISSGIFWILLIYAIELALVMGLALLLSAANVFFRDVQYIIEVAVAFGFYATPVFYELSTIGISQPAWLGHIFLINPLAGLITVFREVLFDGHIAHPLYLVWPAIAAILSLGAGAYVFRKNAGAFADNL
jgi:lipopolysaccharide transport system permease protein